MTHRLARWQISAKEPPAQLFMPLRLCVVTGVHGIYGARKSILPRRMRYLSALGAAQTFDDIRDSVVVSDMFRSPEASLRAKRERRGAQRPAYSGHNYGYSIDLAVAQTMRRLRLKSKRALDEFMVEYGWYCHRRDHRRDFEEWHYNYFGREFSQYVLPKDRRTSAGLERMITARHGKWWHRMAFKDAQRALARLGLYDGDIDGKFGPLSKEALRVFQRAWLIPTPHGTLNTMSKRTLAYVTADRQEIS